MYSTDEKDNLTNSEMNPTKCGNKAWPSTRRHFLSALILMSFGILPLVSCSHVTDWDSLENSLVNSTLYGPVNEVEYSQCYDIDDAYDRAKSVNGICMQTVDCGYEFCDPKLFGNNLPLYTLDARSEEDIVTAVNFAASNTVEISVKTTGSSLQGTSTKKDSLLIWMTNFPKDGEIKEDYEDGCGNTHDVVGIGGGETWHDVLEAVKESYTVVSANEKSISAAGGWLQGGGISYNSRRYGLGIDNVVDFRVVLMDGSVVIANECTNTDLFWSLRGGGGGTFGVVTHIHYKLHEPTKIVQFNFKIYGRENLTSGDERYYGVAINQWLNFFISHTPSLDKNWCGGSFGHDYAHLLYCGEMVDAKLSFLNEFISWENNVLIKTGMRPGIWGSIFATTVYRNWYEYTCFGVGTGSLVDEMSESFIDPAFIDPKRYNPGEDISVRIMPLNRVISNSFGVMQMLLNQKLVDTSFGLSNYFLGGCINEVDGAATSVHPAMRKSIYSISTKGSEASDIVRDFIPNDITGVDYNYHNVLEPDWRNACWGSNYARLMQIKKDYDSGNILNCWHCVGFLGVEIPERTTLSPTSTSTKAPSMTPTSYQSSLPSTIPSYLPSIQPTWNPTDTPSHTPSLNFSSTPSSEPSEFPSRSSQPSPIPSMMHSDSPTSYFSSQPSISPSSPQPIRENPHAKFLLKDDETRRVVRKCKWLAKKSIDKQRNICTSKYLQRLNSLSDNLGPASIICFDTCAPYCPEEADNAKFVFETKAKNDGKIEVVTRQCKWLAKRRPARKVEICSNIVDYDGYVYGQAYQVCTSQCLSCHSLPDNEKDDVAQHHPKNIFK